MIDLGKRCFIVALSVVKRTYCLYCLISGISCVQCAINWCGTVALNRGCLLIRIGLLLSVLPRRCLTRSCIAAYGNARGCSGGVNSCGNHIMPGIV